MQEAILALLRTSIPFSGQSKKFSNTRKNIAHASDSDVSDIAIVVKKILEKELGMSIQ